MNPASSSFVAGLAALAVFAVLALAILRIPSRMAPVTRLGLLAMVIHLLATTLLICCVPAATYWHGAALYWFGFNSFIFGFSAVYKSVSLGILSKLAHRADQSIALHDIVEEEVRPCFEQRMSLLLQTEMTLALDDKYLIAPRGIALARRIALVQNFFGVKRSGLYGATPPR